MLFADFETTEGRYAAYRIVRDVLRSLFARGEGQFTADARA